jgi:hypothetical protein
MGLLDLNESKKLSGTADMHPVMLLRRANCAPMVKRTRSSRTLSYINKTLVKYLSMQIEYGMTIM